MIFETNYMINNINYYILYKKEIYNLIINI